MSVKLTNSLATLNPELAAEWHPTKNGALTPHDVTVSSNKRVWWLCKTNPQHEWDVSINNRTKRSGCRFCSGRRATPETCLAKLNPELAAEWHPTKNGALTPHDVTVCSRNRVWWLCRTNPQHEWDVRIVDRTKGNGCRFCSGQAVDATNSLAKLNPELVAEWHPTKNGALTPHDVTVCSHRESGGCAGLTLSTSGM